MTQSTPWRGESAAASAIYVCVTPVGSPPGFGRSILTLSSLAQARRLTHETLSVDSNLLRWHDPNIKQRRA